MSAPTLRAAIREFRIALARTVYPDLHIRADVEETLTRLDALGLTDAEKREALDAATKFAMVGAGGLIDVLLKIASTWRITGEDLHQLHRRGIKIHVCPETVARMAPPLEDS